MHNNNSTLEAKLAQGFYVVNPEGFAVEEHPTQRKAANAARRRENLFPGTSYYTVPVYVYKARAAYEESKQAAPMLDLETVSNATADADQNGAPHNGIVYNHADTFALALYSSGRWDVYHKGAPSVGLGVCSPYAAALAFCAYVDRNHK